MQLPTVLTIFSLLAASTVQAQDTCVTCLVNGLDLPIKTTVCPPKSTILSVSTKSILSVTTLLSIQTDTVTKTVTATKTTETVPSCTERSAQFYLASPTPGCAASFSELKRTEIVPGQCVNVADIGGTAFTPKGYFEVVANDNLPGEKCFINVFTVADCKGGAQTSYGSSVAGKSQSLNVACTQFKTNTNKAVVSFKYTCGCGNASSAKLLFGRDSAMSIDEGLL